MDMFSNLQQHELHISSKKFPKVRLLCFTIDSNTIMSSARLWQEFLITNRSSYPDAIFNDYST